MDRQDASNIISSTEGPTPPLAHGSKRAHSNGTVGRGLESGGSEAVDAESLSKALQEFKEASYTREKTPTGSPSRKRQRIYGDR